MSDAQQIESTINTYFECMFESDAAKAREAFHPDARIVGYMRGKLSDISSAEFAEFVASRQPSPKQNGDTPRLEILSIETAGDTAVARVRDDYLGMTFVDTLSLLKVDGRWTIYNKLYHVES